VRTQATEADWLLYSSAHKMSLKMEELTSAQLSIVSLQYVLAQA